MNRLPQEIINHVAWWLPLPEEIHCRNGLPSSPIRPSIASVSEKFRHAVERLTFHELHIKTSELEKFDQILSGAGSYRRRFLTRLNVVVVLPEYGDHKVPTYEFAVDRYANNYAATRGMHQLLYVLSGWESDLRLELTLDAQSPSDSGALTSKQCYQRWKEIEQGTRHGLGHERYEYSMTEIFDPNRLCRVLHQAVNHVAHLKLHGEVDPSLFWPYQPSEKPQPFWQSMKKLEITMEQDSTSAEWYQRTNFNKWSQKTIARYGNDYDIDYPVNHAGLPAPGHGTASQAKRAHRYINTILQHERTLYDLTYRTLVDGGFKDDDDDDGSDHDNFQNSNDADESKYEHDDAREDEMLQFCEANEPAMARLLDAMMKAMLQMRRLEFVRLEGCLGGMWCFEFYAPGVPSKYDAKSEATPSYARFILPKHHFWIPGEEILNGFRNMAKEKYGQQPAIVWVTRIRRN
ncbi:hypothetical protein K4K49_011248 [Colletotrichum sp. SAR 10_70]|nr:hypothetical protein K4K50_004719 [Colletotrichum sp. SAR 10_71]KAI8178844.1 hypothetical protein K4K51_004199 [Colletotrichum sp. SAR 10_75]KAI8192909.1 hypothetical protein K4K49_011248 [Colletotrichum sp. SAR 10_70]KAI8205684.1 hypothetical protein K4K52_003985 [Colletotrichum sp. SAR 10_76]KAI8235503.1 hypothetical protein K4K54_006183 [Colletotrichum sp. SAR 10_86]KAJ4999694.1 hypothetical protein K4K48_003640 [Colletotrichum sp. SAR 10_66]